MQLYDYFRSSAAFRVRIALNLKELEYDRVPVNLVAAQQRDEDYLALNPQGLVPAIVTEEGSVLTQSIAILEWLEEAHPEVPLLPREALARARVRAMVQTVACDIHPLNNLRVLNYLTGPLGVDEENKLSWYRHWIALGFAALEQQVEGPEFCFGNTVSLADVCLVPQVYNARRFAVDMQPYPRLQAISAALEQQPAFTNAAPAAVAPA
ncbi:maleylacetoacetate isomerase [Kineobactrum sediminis]|uniref:Maleylacetoacetate isomerase n=1 Tax=Kineobactrum sediminis TaxID=1905677 RepID=A0A2N5Y2V8_9GAMM|nr:maleylacetoacetate isomerase [Kineobactrum sediminis]PLW82699.1 maleylacetoacetate isomerase [Kineobactrum sediminis]